MCKLRKRVKDNSKDFSLSNWIEWIKSPSAELRKGVDSSEVLVSLSLRYVLATQMEKNPFKIHFCFWLDVRTCFSPTTETSDPNIWEVYISTTDLQCHSYNMLNSCWYLNLFVDFLFVRLSALINYAALITLYYFLKILILFYFKL